MNLVNDVSIARSLELITEQDTFKKRNVDMRQQRTFREISAISPAYHPATMKSKMFGSSIKS